MSWRRILAVLAWGCGAVAFGCSQPAKGAPVYGYEVIASYPHDPEAFTEGLIARDGFLYESTGLEGASTIRKVDLATGIVLKRTNLDPSEFGEGLTARGNDFFLLTWDDHVAYRYVERDSFEQTAAFAYPWSGWGLTHDGAHLIASDGTARIRFLDPQTLALQSSIIVRDDGLNIQELNELEYIGGRIYANVWHSDRIAVIDPASGNVEAWLDLGGLRDSMAYDPHIDVLNGTAFDPAGARLFVTGKRWPRLFEIRVPTLQGVAEPSAARAPGLSVQCVPNPCRVRGVILFESSAQASASLALFDAEGRFVRALVGPSQPPGMQAIVLDATGLAAGTYFARISSAGRVGMETIRVLR